MIQIESQDLFNVKCYYLYRSIYLTNYHVFEGFNDFSEIIQIHLTYRNISFDALNF